MITLFKHQEKALKATEHRHRVAYYLDMGLGKTFVGSEKMKELGENINLVLCQKAKIKDWYEHFKTFYPDHEAIVYNKHHIPKNKKVILIINYELAWRREALMGLKDFTLMLDESSMIKSLKSNRTKFVLKLKPKNVILLSGTPISGKYEELYSQVKLLGWNITKKAFFERYIITRAIDICGFKKDIVVGYKNVDDLKAKLREYGAVFMKTEEAFDLPDIREIHMQVQNTKEYAKFKKDRLVTVKQGTKEKEIVGDTSLTTMLGFRQLSSLYNQNKYEELKTILESTESRIVLFYNFTEEAEKIMEICKDLKKPVSLVNGQKRDLDNYDEFENSVVLVQYQAGAMGLNLQKSNIMIYFSLPLSSDLFEQSKKRIHRIGQKNNCIYYYLITKNSIDEQIYKTLLKRKDFTDRLFKED